MRAPAFKQVGVKVTRTSSSSRLLYHPQASKRARSRDRQRRRCGKALIMNNLYSCFTHAQNIQDGCCLVPGANRKTRSCGFVPIKAAQTSKDIIALIRSESRACVLRYPAAGRSDWTDRGCRTSRGEEAAPSAHRQRAACRGLCPNNHTGQVVAEKLARRR